MFSTIKKRRIPVYSLAHCRGPKSAVSATEKTDKDETKILQRRAAHGNVRAAFCVLLANTRNLKKTKADSTCLLRTYKDNQWANVVYP